ncbi:MAG: cell division protein FtsA [Alphaproteobacteria bacterium]|nr:MAG: cell division protein FtsA [Alphaproteobacteria bacterium]
MTARRRHHAASEEPVVVLDIGSAKVTALIGRRAADGRVEVLGIGHRQSAGIRAGFVVDIAAAEHAVRASVDQAERLAGLPVEEAVVSVNLAPMVNGHTAVALTLNGGEVTQRVLERLAQAARHRLQRWLQQATVETAESIMLVGNLPCEPRMLMPLHLRPVLYRLDGVDSPEPPLGLRGERIELTVQLLAVPRAPLSNLQALVERAHLRAKGFVAAPLAAGLGCLTADERELGAAVVDIGAGRTVVGIFAGGRFLYGDSLPIGGDAITRDIAEGLLTPPAHAERLKCLYGHAAPSRTPRREMIDVRRLGDGIRDEIVSLPRAALDEIIAARILEIVERAADSLAQGGFAGPAARRIVVAGGTAQLAGIEEAFQHIHPEWSVRLGRPRGVFGLAEATQGPAFATAAGLLKAVAAMDGEISLDLGGSRPPGSRSRAAGFVGIGRWLKENF